MKVIYKKPILEQIHAVIHEAKENNREIDHIHITKAERNEIRKVLNLSFKDESDFKMGTIMGVKFVVEDDVATGQFEKGKAPSKGEVDKMVEDVLKHVFGLDVHHAAKA